MLVPGKERFDVGAHDVLNEHERHAAAGELRRQLEKAWQHRWQLDARELGPPLMLDRHREVLAPVGDVREGVAGVERERCQHRRDLALKIAGQERRQLLRVLSRLEELDAVGRELGAKRIGPASGLLIEHLPRPRANQRQLLLGRQAVGRDVLALGPHLFLQDRNANHEELVEVGPDDGEELDAFEQGMASIPRLVEDALVEGQPAELAVEVKRRGVEGRSGRDHGRPVCTGWP